MALTKYVKMGIKRYLNNSLAYLPDRGEMLKNIYRRLRYEKKKSVLKVKLLFTKYHIPDPETIYWIDPERIVFHTNYNKGGNPDFKDRVFDMIKDKGRVYGGAWDVSPYKFSDLDVYKAFEQRIRYGMEWEETEFYKNELTQIETGRKLWGCENRIDWDERCRYLDLLIQSIREQGYKLAHQVSVSGGKVGHFLLKEMSEEVTVNIGQNGQYHFQDGRHRLSIAKILAVKRIPVKILVRHKKWQELRENLISMAKGSGGATSKQGVLYQLGNHLDLSDIPAAHFCEDRLLAMKKSLRITCGKVLDLGANLCYFCHKFEELGFMCYGVENDVEIAEIANRIRIAEGRKFKIISGDVLSPRIQNQIRGIDFDVVLALNIFHHFLKTESNFNKFRQLLAKLKVKMIYFEPHLYHEEQMKNSYVNFTEDEFIRFIQAHTLLNNFEIVHEASDGRHVYKLY